MARPGGVRLKQLALDLVILLLVADAGALAAGWLVSNHYAADLSAAHSATARCTDANDAGKKLLDKIKADHKNDQADLALQKQQAAQAQQANAATIKNLRRQAQDRYRAIEESPRGHPDCDALAHLAVCPAAARWLWPQAQGDHARPAH